MIYRWRPLPVVLLAAIGLCGVSMASEPVVSTFAGNGKSGMNGDGGDRRKASLANPTSMAWLDAENLLYLDMGKEGTGRVRRVNLATNVIETVVGGGAKAPDSVPAREAMLSDLPVSLAVDSKGNLYIGYQASGRVNRVDARTGLIARYAGGGESLADGVAPHQLALKRTSSVRVDPDDNIYIVDSGLYAVFRIDGTTGRVTRVAGTPGFPGHAGDGGPARSALLNRPMDVGWDSDGNLYVVDQLSHVIRRVSASDGTIDTIAGTAGTPGFSGDGEAAVGARFRYPESLLVEDGQILVADRMNHRIRRIDLTSGVITTVAGSNRAGYAGENIPAVRAGMFEPTFLLRDAAGGLLVVATRARRIYLVGDPVAALVPWWRTRWAIGAYLLCLGLLTLGVVQLRTRNLRESNRLLESLVRQRVTELDEQQAMIKRQTVELVSLIEARDRLLAKVSHEFRTPLTVIGGMTNRSLDRTPEGAVGAALGAIAQKADTLLGLVEKLLTLAHLRHAADEAHVEPELNPKVPEQRHVEDWPRDALPHHEATVLIVEDNDDMREYLRAALAPRYRCLLASDGAHGVRLALEELPDIVISDVMLPGQDGYAVCREIKGDERTSHIPVILLTALEGEDHKLRGLEERAEDYLTKPFNEAELLQRIRNMLEIRSLLQRRYARELRFDEHPPAELNTRDRGFLVKLAQVAAAQHGNPEFDTSAIASALAASERQLQRKLKALTGLTPAEYLREYRLQQALARLRAGERPGEVAYAVGFNSQPYFTTCFKAQFGYTPGEARQRAAAEA
jgi:DNA-binding response OmpR family regulator/sugar lactone lactonase YvrE